MTVRAPGLVSTVLVGKMLTKGSSLQTGVGSAQRRSPACPIHYSGGGVRDNEADPPGLPLRRRRKWLRRSCTFTGLRMLCSDDVAIVGGKNASLGEMICALKDEGILVPDGFATTADAFHEFLEANGLMGNIRAALKDLQRGYKPLDQVGRAIRRLFERTHFPEAIAEAIGQAYRELSRRYQMAEADVAVRSSATAEDLPEASFAGQQETFLNVTGEEALLEACRNCYASLFTDRAISYRQEKGFDHLDVALSVGVQKMVRADRASAGVMFSIDTETGFPHVVVINAAWGLGEYVVQGAVTPDQYLVFKPLLGHQKLRPIIEKTLGDKDEKARV